METITINNKQVAIPTRPFGVELEVEGIADSFRRNRRGVGRGWQVIRDASLSYNGREFVSPILRGQNGAEQVIHACQVINACDHRIGRSCGYHVHIGVPNWARSGHGRRAFVGTLANAAQSIKAELLAVVARSRRNHRLLRPTFTANLMDRQKFMAITCHKISQGHVEFRLHGGTTDPAKILNWAAFASAVVDKVVAKLLSGRTARPLPIPQQLSEEAIGKLAVRLKRAIHIAKETGSVRVSDMANLGNWGSETNNAGNRVLRAMARRGVVVERPEQGFFRIDFQASNPRALPKRHRRIMEWAQSAQSGRHSLPVNDLEAVLRRVTVRNSAGAFRRLARSLRRAGVPVELNAMEGELRIPTAAPTPTEQEPTTAPALPARVRAGEFALTAQNYGDTLGEYFTERRNALAA